VDCTVSAGPELDYTPFGLFISGGIFTGYALRGQKSNESVPRHFINNRLYVLTAFKKKKKLINDVKMKNK